MDFCEGRVLFSEDQNLDWFCEYCLALKHVHNKNFKKNVSTGTSNQATCFWQKMGSYSFGIAGMLNMAHTVPVVQPKSPSKLPCKCGGGVKSTQKSCREEISYKIKTAPCPSSPPEKSESSRRRQEKKQAVQLRARPNFHVPVGKVSDDHKRSAEKKSAVKLKSGYTRCYLLWTSQTTIYWWRTALAWLG